MDPMAQAAAGTQASQSDWSALKASAGRGELLFEPAAAEKCAQVCEDAIAQVDDHLRETRNLLRVAGFGTPSEGQQLAQKFVAKANEAMTVLKAHRQVLQDMRDTYRAAGRAYHQTDAGTASAFKAHG